MILSTAHAAIKGLFGWSVATDPLHETAWLDGVRGTAAFLVLLNHFNLEWMPTAEVPYGATAIENRNPDGVYYYKQGDHFNAPWRLPLLRLLVVSGSAQVAVFFVLSGLVLSWSPLRSIHAGNTDKLFHSLSSSVLRRWSRLFLPCIIVGLFYYAHRVWANWHGISGIFTELWHYITATEKWANFLETSHSMQFSTNNEYAFVMWTIPFEYGGSVFVYITLLGLCRVRKTVVRIMIALGIGLYACDKKLWGFWLFAFGLALADYVQAYGGFRKLSAATTTPASLIWYALFVSGLLLMSWVGTDELYISPGYWDWTASIPIPDGYRGLVGEQRFWYGWGGILVLLSASHLRRLQTFFELSFIQYLGRLSFMLYLIHFWVNIVVAIPIRHKLYSSFCVKEHDDLYNGDVFRSTTLFNIGAHITLWLINIPIVFILSNILEIWVDRPCTNFGKWLDNRLMGNVPKKEEKIVHDEEQHNLLPDSDALELERLSSDHERIELGRRSTDQGASLLPR